MIHVYHLISPCRLLFWMAAAYFILGVAGAALSRSRSGELNYVSVFVFAALMLLSALAHFLGM